MMSRKILTSIILVIAIALISCSNYNEFKTDEIVKSTDDAQFQFDSNITEPELNMDGLDNETIWDDSLQNIVYGRNNSVTMKLLIGEDAIYVYYEVVDHNILTLGYNNGNDVTHSDSVEFYLSATNHGGLSPKEGDFQINIGAHGKSRVLRGVNNSWENWNGLIDYAVHVDGTVNDETDVDQGYSVELMLPFNQINIEAGDDFGFAIGHVDKEYNQDVMGIDYDWYGFTFSGVFADPQIPHDYLVYHQGEIYHFDGLPVESKNIQVQVTDTTGTALVNAKIEIPSLDIVGYTDQSGQASFEVDSLGKDLLIFMEKDGFMRYSEIIKYQELRSETNYTLQAEMTLAYYANTSLTFSVENSSQALADVSISVNGQTTAISSDISGDVLLESIDIDGPLTISLSKTGYQSLDITLYSNDINFGGQTDLGVIEMSLPASETFSVAGNKAIDEFEGQVYRTATGICFDFKTVSPFTSKESLEIFIDTKTSGYLQTSGDYRFTISGDQVLTAYEWGINDYLNPQLLGVTASFKFDDSFTYVKVFIPYSAIDVASTEIFGLSFGVWSLDVNDWDGWDYSGYIAPEITNLYVRVGIDNQLYKSESN